MVRAITTVTFHTQQFDPLASNVLDTEDLTSITAHSLMR